MLQNDKRRRCCRSSLQAVAAGLGHIHIARHLYRALLIATKIGLGRECIFGQALLGEGTLLKVSRPWVALS